MGMMQVMRTRVLAVVFIAILTTSCGTTVIHDERIDSPDGLYVAELKEDMGGGGAGFVSTSVCLSTSRFSSRLFGRGCVFVVADLGDVKLTWRSSRELEITYPARSNESITAMSPSWRDVKIQFASAPQQLIALPSPSLSPGTKVPD